MDGKTPKEGEKRDDNDEIEIDRQPFASLGRQSEGRTVGSFELQTRKVTTPGGSFVRNDHGRRDEEVELRKAAAEAYKRWRSTTADDSRARRMALIRAEGEKGSAASIKEIDVKRMKVEDHKIVAAKALATQDPDYAPFLKRLRDRMDKVGIELSTVEVRWENLDIETDVFVGSRALPTVTNAFIDYAQTPFNMLGLKLGGKRKFPILQDMSGVLKPGRFTLLLGPPSSGKSTLLKALSGKLDKGSLRVKGIVTYNGHTLDEFVCQRTSSYIEQRDVHIAELTVRETFDFAARCQGVGHKAAELKTLMEREAAAGIDPDPEIDAFMKAEAHAGSRYSVVTELMMRLLGLDRVADGIIGNEMIRGISGGQKKRVTTGEMIVGPKKTLFMDEISTGLDSSTTQQITQILADFCHIRDATILLALLQPAPEVYNLFDDILLLSEGHIVFHGPREEVLPFFESMGFKLPERKGIADFLQEVTSPKDQAQYWADPSKPYRFIPVTEFAEAFKRTQSWQRMQAVLAMPYDRAASPEGALVQRKYGLPFQKALRATLRREILLYKKNSFIYVFRTFQVLVTSFMAATLFFRTTRHPNSIEEANYYLGVLFFSEIAMLFNNWAEFALIVDRLPVFFKQRNNYFYPTATFAIPTMVLSIPQALLESLLWSSMVYWVVGLQPSASGFFTFWLFMFLIHQFSVALFRLVGAVCRTPNFANATSSVVALFFLVNGGFILPRTSVRWWWRWMFYINPLSWGMRSIALNEFRAPRWQKPSNVPGVTIGNLLLEQRAFENSTAWLWTGVPFIFCSIILMDVMIVLALTFLSSPDKPGGGTVPEEEVAVKQAAADGKPIDASASGVAEPGAALKEAPSRAASGSGNGDVALDMHGNAGGAVRGSGEDEGAAEAAAAKQAVGQGRSTLPFQQLWLSFHHVWYSVDLPSGMDPPDHPKNDGSAKPRLYLLNDVSGAFRPNVLTALIGETGAGKTTLMDVLAGRKTGGIIEGDVRVQGHPKEQTTFARVAGYVEQNDIHSPQTTVREALLFSASLRLTADNLDNKTVNNFVDEIMEIVELTPLRDALVGLPGRSGLSVEQRKRLTIAVELVANPSIVFMDEPTSGLDARAAAIVMRAVRNTVDTGRTVVCTIHQPSIDIFESFDELLLMKRGGRIIFHGPLGKHSCKLIEYFQGIDGVTPIHDGYNPATWALEVTNSVSERRIGIDFADAYESSALYKRTDTLVEELSVPPEGSQPLSFPTRYSRNWVQQYRICLWKNHVVYWKYPDYNSVRFIFTLVLAFIFGTSFWGVGNNYSTQSGILAVAGALFSAAMFLGVYNSSSVQPVVSTERSVFYRERAAGMYSALPYALAQATIELPYVAVQSTLFTLLIYAMIKFRWEAAQFWWFMLFEFLALLLFTYYGIMSVALTPNVVAASIISGTAYFTFALMCGFVLQAVAIPGWWIWLYYINPVSWILYGTVTSQLGDIHDKSLVTADGSMEVIANFITDFFGFHHNLLGVCVAVLSAEIIIFLLLTSWSYAKITWEKR